MPQINFFWTSKLVEQRFHPTLCMWYAFLIKGFWAKQIGFNVSRRALRRGYELSFTTESPWGQKKFTTQIGQKKAYIRLWT